MVADPSLRTERDLAAVCCKLPRAQPGRDGNRLIASTLSNNNRGGDPDAGVSRTADVLIFSAVVPITGTVISGNWLSDVDFGIWTQNAHASLSGNHFDDVVVHVHQG
ncbi:MAG: hypothetical protein ACJ738_14675 [Gaiellales bacterium]